jgi:hypothetical protein
LYTKNVFNFVLI